MTSAISVGTRHQTTSSRGCFRDPTTPFSATVAHGRCVEDVGRCQPGAEAAATRRTNWGRASSSGAELRCNTAILGGKCLDAPYFPFFRWLVGVSAGDGEPPGEAVKRQQIASFELTGYYFSTTGCFLILLFLIS